MAYGAARCSAWRGPPRRRTWPPGGMCAAERIDLGGVLAGEGAATVRAPAAVGVDDDLAAGEAGIAVGAADGEAAGGVEVEDGVGVEERRGNHLLDHLLHGVLGDLLVVHRLVVLGGDEHGVHRWGRIAPPSFLYSIVTWVLPSGRTQGQVPFLRTSVRR